MTTFARCCCVAESPPSEALCPALPADWATRAYQLVIPTALPLQYSSPQIPTTNPYDKGWCDVNDAGNVGYCTYVNSLFGYYSWWDPCTTTPGAVSFCWKASKELQPQYGGGYWNTLRADIDPVVGNAFRRFETGNANAGARLDVTVERCWNPTPGWNRTRVVVNATLWETFTARNCPTGTLQSATVISEYSAQYIGDPFTAAQAISPLVYLKTFQHISPRHYCATPDGGYWAVPNLHTFSNAPGGVLYSSPCPLPLWLQINRTA